MTEEAYDATASWSGYIYQGKVALYHALKIINEQEKTDQPMDISGLELEIEWEEDFSVKYNNDYISYHQVKAYKAPPPSAFKDAIKGVLSKLSSNVTADAFLHIWEDIQYSDDKRSVANFSELVDRYGVDKQGQSYSPQVVNRFAVYTYNGIPRCGLSSISDLMKDEIIKFYASGHCGEIPRTSSQYEGVRVALYGLLDKFVIYRHTHRKDSSTKSIRFAEIEGLFHVNFEISSDEYISLLTKEYLIQKIFEFCDNTRKCHSIKCDSSCNLMPYICFIESMSPEAVFLFIKERSPHIPDSSLLRHSGVRDALLDMLHKLPFNDFSRHFLDRFKKNYLPTTIDERQDCASQIAKDIICNGNLDSLPVLYEADYLIALEINIDSLAEAAQDLRTVPLEGLNFPERVQDKITKIKNLKITSLESAIKAVK
jgi:hypothetical protein